MKETKFARAKRKSRKNRVFGSVAPFGWEMEYNQKAWDEFKPFRIINDFRYNKPE